MPVSVKCSAAPFLLFSVLSALLRCSIQDTLSCGGTSFQITFEPSRPQFSSAGSNIGIGGGGGGGGGNSAKYAFQPLESLLSNKQVCNLSVITGATQPLLFDQQLMRQQPSAAGNTRVTMTGGAAHDDSLGNNQRGLVITKCDNCSQCPQELPLIHRVMSKLAAENGFQSLLVIIGHKESERVKVVENTLAKFVYMTMDEDIGPLTLCELTDTADNDALKSFSKTSVLFVSISFIILMVISLAWLVFYYVQRFRYAHAKDRLQRRLFNAAKKALTRIPTRPVKAGDKELDADCPVCIDPYRTGDIVRMLPCRHIFHKSCVDPWLLEHRTCPMCKSDILKAFGYHVSVNSRRRAQFSSQEDGEGRRVHHHHNDSDHLSVDANSTTSESNAFPFPVVSEIHDPFSFTPSTSPQLVQVMHATNARSFSIIPLTVHSGCGAGYTQSSSSSTQTGGRDEGIGSGYGATLINASIERHNQNTGGLPTVVNVVNNDANIGSATPSSSGSRLLRAMTSGARRPLSRGHVVNLVHVRSRSLSHAQLPLSNNFPITMCTNGEVTGNAPIINYRNSLQSENSHKIHRPTALFRSTQPSIVPHPLPSAEASSATESPPNFDEEEQFPFVRTKASQYSVQPSERWTNNHNEPPHDLSAMGIEEDRSNSSHSDGMFLHLDQEMLGHMPNYVPVIDPSVCPETKQQSVGYQLIRGQNDATTNNRMISTAPAHCRGAQKHNAYARNSTSIQLGHGPPILANSSSNPQRATSSMSSVQLPSNEQRINSNKQSGRAVPSSHPISAAHFDAISVESL